MEQNLQSSKVFGDNCVQRMLLTGGDGNDRAHGAPHLLAFTSLAIGLGYRRGHCRDEGIENRHDRLRELPQFGPEFRVFAVHRAVARADDSKALPSDESVGSDVNATARRMGPMAAS